MNRKGWAFGIGGVVLLLALPLLFRGDVSPLPDGYRVTRQMEPVHYGNMDWERVEMLALVPRSDLPKLEERWKAIGYRRVADTSWSRKGTFSYEPAIFLMPALMFPGAGKVKESEYVTVRTLDVKPAKLWDELKFRFLR